MKRLSSLQLLLTLFLFAVLLPSCSNAQPAHPAAAPAPPTLDATSFGSPVDLLSQPWLFHIGSDPAWAAPNLDDSRWLQVSKGVPLRKYGFPDVESYWYRFHLRLPPNARNLALYFSTGGANLAVYANGQLISQHGGLTPGSSLEVGPLQPISIPNPLLAAAQGNLTLAFHVYTGPLGKVLPGLFDYKGIRVMLTTPDAARTSESYDLTHQYASDVGVAGLQAVVGLCGLFLFFAIRSQREYLALAVWMFANALSPTLDIWNAIHSASYFSSSVWLGMAAGAASTVAMIEFVRLITRTRRTRWLLGLEVLIVAVQSLVPFAINGRLPLNLSFAAYFVPIIVSDIVLPILLLRSALRKNLDARLILVPFVLWAIVDFYNMIGLFTLTLTHKFLSSLPSLHIYSYSIGLDRLFDVVGLLCLLLIILTRTTRLARERASLAAEVQAAEQVQALLLSRASAPTPGYSVETAYRPMGEVGGDFFFVSSHPDDDSLLVVVGDVSGKGMGAAMRVSLILGVLSSQRVQQPELVLAELNTALLAQEKIGFTTACCVRLERDGNFSFSNAGHLNPYVDGVELASPGSLPLGLVAVPEFQTAHGTLQPGQRMVLVSDGVLEARTGKGELLGFDRLVHVTRMTAHEIADTAQHFGQNDDITVLSLALA